MGGTNYKALGLWDNLRSFHLKKSDPPNAENRVGSYKTLLFTSSEDKAHSRNITKIPNMHACEISRFMRIRNLLRTISLC